jgi:hypothetical protein
MMSRAPELMFRALTLHNNIIRKAKWVNCGFTLEQEGDSYALVFYDALDAVAFCLQARRGGLGGLCSRVVPAARVVPCVRRPLASPCAS